MSRPDTGDRQWGAKLRALREEARLTRQRVAERIFVDATALSSWELGRTAPSAESLGRLREIFPALSKISADRPEKPEGNHAGRPRAREAGAVWQALAEVGAEARNYAVRHRDVIDPVHGWGQILGQEGSRALVMFNKVIKWTRMPSAGAC